MGTYLKYKDRRFAAADLDLVRAADAIVAEYEGAGLTMTLRQLYYQFVSRDALPNRIESYNRLKTLVSDGRMAGLISWTGIEDRLRAVVKDREFAEPLSAMKTWRKEYHIDAWATQLVRPEVWSEKDALSGVLEPICDEERVGFFACRGYTSQSAQWRAGQRFARQVRKGQRPVVIHLGDHDPSGIDMTRDNRERLETFAGVPVLVVRIALNFDQVERYRPPPNPAKLSDSRAADYVEKYGKSSWELDALSPAVLRDLVTGAIAKYRDPAPWDAAMKKEAADKLRLDDVIEEMSLEE